MVGAPSPPPGPNICIMQLTGAKEAPKYVDNAQAIFWTFAFLRQLDILGD